MIDSPIAERLQEALLRLQVAADAVVWADPNNIPEDLMDELADAAFAAEGVLAGKPAAGGLT